MKRLVFFPNVGAVFFLTTNGGGDNSNINRLDREVSARVVEPFYAITQIMEVELPKGNFRDFSYHGI